jgi:CubicO group peptidase (beta-lactamase class C family)
LTPSELARITGQIWPESRASSVGIAVVDAGGTAMHGEIDRVFPLASVTKLLVAYATLVAIEEGSVELDAPIELGTSLRHLLAHASGMAPDERRLMAPPETRRIYSNAGFEAVGEVLAAATGIDVRSYLEEAVLTPLGMVSTSLDGSPASGASSTAADLARFAAELMAPTLVADGTLDEATAVQLPGLDGVLPGFGRQTPNDWGLGFELHDAKHPHWTAPNGSARTFGHFGRSGTFLWIDPDAHVGCVYLGDAEFGPWAIDAWPVFNGAVLEAAKG